MNASDVAWVQSDWGASFAVLEGKEPYDEKRPFTFLVQFPPHFRVPLHEHLSTERITALHGSVKFGITRESDGDTVMLRRGGVALIPAGVPHYGFTEEEGSILFVHGVGPHNAPDTGPSPPAGSELDGKLPEPIIRARADDLASASWLPSHATALVLEGHPPFAPGKELTMRVRLQSGSSLAMHAHRAVERLVILDGTILVTVEGTAPKQLNAGAVAIIPALTRHAFTALTAVTIQVHAIAPYTLAGS